jgi:hypothetical protein
MIGAMWKDGRYPRDGVEATLLSARVMCLRPVSENFESSQIVAAMEHIEYRAPAPPLATIDLTNHRPPPTKKERLTFPVSLPAFD